MTKSAVVTWVLPTNRTSGRPLDLNEVAGVDVWFSADLGANFVILGTVPPGNPQTRAIPDLVDGDYIVRLVVRMIGTLGVSLPVDTPFFIDTSAPRVVTAVNVTLI
jgi:hypothetical protein